MKKYLTCAFIVVASTSIAQTSGGSFQDVTFTYRAPLMSGSPPPDEDSFCELYTIESSTHGPSLTKRIGHQPEQGLGNYEYGWSADWFVEHVNEYYTLAWSTEAKWGHGLPGHLEPQDHSLDMAIRMKGVSHFSIGLANTNLVDVSPGADGSLDIPIVSVKYPHVKKPSAFQLFQPEYINGTFDESYDQSNLESLFNIGISDHNDEIVGIRTAWTPTYELAYMPGPEHAGRTFRIYHRYTCTY